MDKTIHICMSIEWLRSELDNMPNDNERRIYCSNCFDMRYQDVIEELERYEKMWYDAIPWEWCDNILPNGHCGWHEK